MVAKELDRGLARLLARASGRYRTMVFASHGMEAFYHLAFMLDGMLWAFESSKQSLWRLRTRCFLRRADVPFVRPLRRVGQPSVLDPRLVADRRHDSWRMDFSTDGQPPRSTACCSSIRRTGNRKPTLRRLPSWTSDRPSARRWALSGPEWTAAQSTACHSAASNGARGGT